MNYDRDEQEAVFEMIEEAVTTNGDIDWGKVSHFFNPDDLKFEAFALSADHPFMFTISGLYWRQGGNTYTPIISPHVSRRNGFAVVGWHIPLSYCADGPDAGTGSGRTDMFRRNNRVYREEATTVWDM